MPFDRGQITVEFLSNHGYNPTELARIVIGSGATKLQSEFDMIAAVITVINWSNFDRNSVTIRSDSESG